MLPELHDFGSKFVEHGGRMTAIFVAGVLVEDTEISPAEVIDQDEDDVGLMMVCLGASPAC